jgi:hypothetical protein
MKTLFFGIPEKSVQFQADHEMRIGTKLFTIRVVVPFRSVFQSEFCPTFFL